MIFKTLPDDWNNPLEVVGCILILKEKFLIKTPSLVTSIF